jgi:RimJ/RimL family protein N-acetyltransferase
MNGWDFVIKVGPTAPEVEPDRVLKTDEANQALHHAYQWAVSKTDSSRYASKVKVFIESIELNRQYDSNHDRADHTQLLYILDNLSYWRGEHAKESRKVLKDYINNISNIT